MKTRITKIFTFDAAHQLKNLPEGHPCSRLHGHTYKLEVTVLEDSRDTFTKTPAFVIDFKSLKDLVQLELLERWDHQFLNDKLPDSDPTAELLAMVALNHLRTFDRRVVKVRVWETPTGYAEVEYEGD